MVVYKSCGEYIVTLEKLIFTNTNEDRKVYDSRYAKYRADILNVVQIEHKITKKCIKEITNTSYKKNTVIYKVGETIEVTDFDTNSKKICTTGIHYFLSKEPAFYYSYSVLKRLRFTGQWLGWNRDGKQKEIGHLVEGRFRGDLVKTNHKGIKEKFNFTNGHLNFAKHQINDDYYVIVTSKHGQKTTTIYLFGNPICSIKDCNVDCKTAPKPNFTEMAIFTDGNISQIGYYKDGVQYIPPKNENS
jgi:hypothetical protein